MPSAKALGTLALGAEVVFLLALESRRPARAADRRPGRLFANGMLGGLALVVTTFVEAPIVRAACAFGERRGLGLARRLPLAPVARTVFCLAAMDYGMYGWHVALHRVPWLWRLHVVHHADRSCDVFNATRIHAVEILVSIVARVVQVLFIGVGVAEITLWERLFAASLLFQHADIELPETLDRLVRTVIVTPRLHAIHHAAERDAQHTNWSSGCTIWDRLHGTYRTAAADAPIGVPAYDRAAANDVRAMLALPFAPQPDDWRA